MGTEVTLKNVVVSFPSVDKPSAVSGNYEITVLPKRGDSNHQLVVGTLENAAKEAFGGKLPKNIRGGVHNGEDKTNKDGEPVVGFDESTVYFVAKNKLRPTVVDRNKNPIDAVRGGNICNVKVDLSAYENSYGKFYGITLKGIQLVAEGETFGGGSPVSSIDDFDVVEDAEEDMNTLLGTDAA